MPTAAHACPQVHRLLTTAEFIHQAAGEFALPVKENPKALFDALDALPWHQEGYSRHPVEVQPDNG